LPVSIQSARLRAESMTTGWLARRCLLGGYTLLIVSLLVFVITQVLPADAAVMLLGENATPEALAAVRARLGLNEPVEPCYSPFRALCCWAAARSC